MRFCTVFFYLPSAEIVILNNPSGLSKVAASLLKVSDISAAVVRPMDQNLHGIVAGNTSDLELRPLLHPAEMRFLDPGLVLFALEYSLVARPPQVIG